MSKAILANTDVMDKRHFDFATARAIREDRGRKIGMSVGAGVAVAGYAASAFLAYSGHDLVATVIAAPITTVLAMIVGNRFLD